MVHRTDRTNSSGPLPALGPDLGASLFVWSVWAVMVLGRAVFTAKYASESIPHADEWFLLLEAPPSFSPQWLWSQWLEHRVPLAKLFWLEVLRLTDYDFRIGNFLLIAAWAAVAFAMIRTASHIRGRIAYSDAFFPMALLTFGQGYNFLWWWTVNQMLAPIVASLLLTVIVASGGGPSAAPAMTTAALLVLLPLCSPTGLPYVVFLVPWLVWFAALDRRTSSALSEPARRLVLMLAALSVALTGAYVVGLRLAGGWPRPDDPVALLRGFIQVLSLAMGGIAWSLWRVIGACVLAVTVACGAMLALVALRRAEERARATGLLAFLIAGASIALVIGSARAGMNESYIFLGTYVPIIVPLLCCVYFASELYVRPVVGPVVAMSLFTLVSLLLVGNLRDGAYYGRLLAERATAFERDLRAGVPSRILAERYVVPEVGHVAPDEELTDLTAKVLARLRATGVGLFRMMQLQPETAEAPIPAQPVLAENIIWRDGTAHGTAAAQRGWLTFSVGEPRFVYAIRMRLSYRYTAGPLADLEVGWSGHGERESPGVGARDGRAAIIVPADPTRKVLKIHGAAPRYEAANPEHVVTVWVNDTIDRFRVSPDAVPCVFTVSEIVLLVPAAPSP